jgi:hypothetical protein
VWGDEERERNMTKRLVVVVVVVVKTGQIWSPNVGGGFAIFKLQGRKNGEVRADEN